MPAPTSTSPTLEQVKAALRKIANDRLGRMPGQGSAAADQQLRDRVRAGLATLDGMTDPGIAWPHAVGILRELEAGVTEAPGCCSYMVQGDSRTFRVTLTRTECAGIQNSSFDPRGPCT